MRLSLGLVAMALLAGGYVVSGLEVESLASTAKQEEIDDELEEERQKVLADEERKKLILASDIRFKDFEQQLLDGYAMLLLEKNPELAEQILAEEKPAAQLDAVAETVAVINTTTANVQDSPHNLADTGDDINFPIVADNAALTELVGAGTRAIDGLIDTSQSIISIGTPGAGKSVSLGVVVGRKKKRFGDRLKLYAIAMKNDGFSGAKVGRLNADSNDCYEILLEVITELRKRAAMPKSERAECCDENPVILILDG